jgi:hypothetical protein
VRSARTESLVRSPFRNERKPNSREHPSYSREAMSHVSTGRKQAAIPCSPAPDGYSVWKPGYAGVGVRRLPERVALSHSKATQA